MLAANLPASLPTVLMNTRVADGKYPSLSIDNYGGACAMVQYLVSCGHRRIAFIAGPANNFDADERLRGYRDALRHGVPEQSEILLAGDFSEESGYRVGLQMRERGDLPGRDLRGQRHDGDRLPVRIERTGSQGPG